MFERNRPDDTFGWGVVLSDETFDNIAANDPVSAAAIRAHFAYWDDIAVIIAAQRIVSTGHGFCGIAPQEAAACCCRSARASSASKLRLRDRDRRAPASSPRTTISSSPRTG